MSQQHPKTRSTCPYCGVGCGVEITPLETGKFDIQGDKNHPSNFGRLCTKGRLLSETLSDDTRLGYPSVNGAKTSWTKSTAYVGSKLRQTIEQYGPESVAFYASGQLLTEDYYVANKLMKGFIGSANIDTNSRLCMSSAVEAHKKAFGRDCVPVCYSDLEKANLIVLVGSNLAWCHPVLHQRIRAEKQARPELKVVVIDPRTTASCELADLHLAINSGTDLLLFNALLTYLADNGYTHHQRFEPNHVEQTLAAAKIDLNETLTDTLGIDAADLQQFFGLFAANEKVVSVFSMGINQSTRGVEQASAIINCHLLTNRMGQPGMGPFSMTGQPNAMGGREVGGLATALASHLSFADPQAHQLLSEFWQTQTLAKTPGLTAVDLFDNVANGKIKAIWIMATNPVVSLPQSAKIKQALKDCPLVIVSDVFATSETVQYADVVFPARAWGEKSGTVTNAERRISRQRAFKPPFEQSQPDWWIVCQVAKAMGFASAFDYQNEAQIFKEHAQLSALASQHTASFDIGALAELNGSQYQRMNPVQWPQAKAGTIELQDLRLFADGKFPTPDGRANMVPVSYSAVVAKPVKGLILNSGRNRDQWHTLTRSGLSAQLNQHTLEPVLTMHPEDATAQGLVDGAIVQISNPQGEMNIRLQISKRVAKGAVFAPIHWSGSNCSGGAINQLVYPDYDPVSKQPAFKSSAITVTPSKMQSEALLLTTQKLDGINTDYWVYQKVSKGYLYHMADKVGPELLLASLSKQLTKQLSNPNQKQSQRLDGGSLSQNRLTRTALVDNKISWSLQVSNNRLQLDASWLTGALSQPVDGRLKCAFISGSTFGDAAKGQIVCLCMKVGLNQVKSCASNKQGKQGCGIQEVGELTGAGTACGSCIGDIAFVLDEAS